MPTQKTKKILVLWGTLSVTIVLIFSVMVWFIFYFDGISTQMSIDIKNETKKGDSFLFLKKDIEANKNSINMVYDYVIKADGMVDFMQFLEDSTSKMNLKSEVKSVTFEAVSGANLKNIEQMKIQMDVTGEWRDVEYFLEFLENYPISLSVKKFSLNKFSDYILKGKKVPQWVGSFEFSVIKLKDK